MAASRKRRIVNVRVCPGEPINGSGRVCIHLFVPDPKGPFVERCVMRPNEDEETLKKGKRLASGPMRGRLACDRRRLVEPITRNGVTTVTPRTDDPRAVTCPKCAASADYAAMTAGTAPTDSPPEQ